MGYREHVWRQFFVFDLWDEAKGRYLPFEAYKEQLDRHRIPYIEPIAVIENPTKDQLLNLMQNNTYLMGDGEGVGEGIVIKNYEWVSKFGRQQWAKLVRAEFKEENRRVFGAPEVNGAFQVECAIAEGAVTAALVQKELAKIRVSAGDQSELDRGKLIPRLLETVYHCVLTEELYAQLKKHKFPTVDFKKLRGFVIARTKKFARSCSDGMGGS